MSFFKKLGSSNKTGAAVAAPQMSDLSASESENASWDFSPEAQAKRDAEKAAAAALPVDEAADEDESSDSAMVEATSPTFSRKGGATKQKLAFRIPDGTNPAVTWPGEKLVDALDNVTYTEQAAIREKFVFTPPVFSKFDDGTGCIKHQNIAPSHFIIDTLENPQALCAEMNLVAGAPTIDHLYDKDTVATAPRFHCPWYKRGAIKRPTNDQMTRTIVHFALPLAASATVQDWHTYLASLPRHMQSSFPLTVAPGAIEKMSLLRYSDGNIKNRKYHSIPVRISLVDVHNTSDLRMEVELRVPNLERRSDTGETFTNASDPIGISSSGPVFASSCKEKLNTVRVMNSYAFNSPEAARWLTIDPEFEEKNFTSNTHGNNMGSNKAGETIISIRLTPEPQNLAQFIAVSYPSQLVAASLNEGVSRPVMNTLQMGKEEGNLYGNIIVPLQALLAVFRHFRKLYDPAQFAVNHHKWVLNASPSNKQGIGLHALRNMAVRDVEQGQVKSAQLEYALEVIHLPYEGPQRLNERDKALLAEIDEDHKVLVDVYQKMAQVELIQATTPGPGYRGHIVGARASPQVSASASSSSAPSSSTTNAVIATTPRDVAAFAPSFPPSYSKGPFPPSRSSTTPTQARI